jgi:hypothetical protein
MTDLELFALDKEGFIPGPNEEEGSFRARIFNAKKKFEEGNWIPDAHWHWVREYLDEVFHVKPLYICAFYSNRSLTPWQGAASWIEGKSLHAVQLRDGLKKGSYLGLYNREEILAHEAIHAVRSGFEETVFEEFFAYTTSQKRWRRVLGPIVQRPWEVWPFLGCVTCGIIWPVCFLGGALWAGLGFCRLIKLHLRLKRAAKQILDCVGEARKVRAVLLRLTDVEIALFADGENIYKYAQTQTCLRWRVIRNYLKDSYGTEDRCRK